jgi:arsenate reductase
MHRSSWLPIFLILAPITPTMGGDEVGPLVRSLWLVQRYGTTEAVTPHSDRQVKGKLAKALGKAGVLTPESMQGLMEPSTFAKLAGPDGKLDAAEVAKALESDIPAARNRLNPRILAHANLLTTSFDMIDETHQEAGDKLVDWIVKNYKPGQPLHITFICTGNSRRSILGATTGNIASAYYGMPEIRFHSGGTAPTAFNPRTITALKEIGVEIEPTGKEAPRGEPKTPNPIYRVSWGQPGEPVLEAIEFSKTYFDAANPQQGFAALLVCSEADEACPLVRGASTRISMPYLDPKIFDGSAFETQKYAERRDDIGRLMMSVMMRVRNQM